MSIDQWPSRASVNSSQEELYIEGIAWSTRFLSECLVLGCQEVGSYWELAHFLGVK